MFKHENLKCIQLPTSKLDKTSLLKSNNQKNKLHFYECYVFVMNVCILYDPVHIKDFIHW